jgi:sigma-E factor negative regulatory protein RseA
MKNGNAPQEKISALADGELESSELNAAFASLRQSEGRKGWDLYHQIGDVLRSEEMAVEMSSGFATRMAAKLDAEPTILAPVAHASIKQNAAVCSKSAMAKRFAMPGLAAVLAVFTAYLVAPQLITDGDAAPAQAYTSSSLASASAPAMASAASIPVMPVAVPVTANASIDASQEAVVLRDPAIDEYLIAHQRYSPSLYDTTQFVQSATFETKPQK